VAYKWLALFLIPLLAPFPIINADSEFDEFQNWADSHGIKLVGVNKNSIQLYYDGFNPKTDTVDWREIPKVLIVADALYKVPENVIQVMDGKTIYFSTEFGRSYTILGSFPDYGILDGLDRGIILERNYNQYTVIHELGHIVDYHGIQGFYNDENHLFEKSSEFRDSIFKVTVEYQPNTSIIPSGYISVYSTANDAENFAENFAHYILYQDKFQEKIIKDYLLEDEYRFLHDQIFQRN